MYDMDGARQRLIEATQALLWERGYAATSPRAILDLSGTGQGSMYHHFGGKTDLAAAALRTSAQGLLVRGEAILAGPGTSTERLTGYLLRQRDVLRGCPVGRMAGDASVRETEVLLAVVRETFERLRAVTVRTIEQGVADGELDAGTTPADLADTILAVVQGGYVLAIAAGDPIPFDRAVRGAVALLDKTRGKDNP